ncbi:MAG: GNAT family N-acetyltransferase [bacterium]|nr:GNAT family N-acetyltransferase [bacterium]MDZ4299959.1 GNAT family N-acetyltransferase [Candidatus Sungbacteria bacterium]
MITYRRLKKTDAVTSRAVHALCAELSKDAGKNYSAVLLARAVKEKNNFICAAYERGVLVGMATLVHAVTLKGMCGRIEDVVVHETMRGKGVGRELMRRLMKEARRQKIKQLELTSRPKRTAANKLYQSLGFTIRETNVYRMML